MTSESLRVTAAQSCQLAFSRFPQGDALFQQCLNSADPVADIVQSLSRQSLSHRNKKSERLLHHFQRYTQWLQNFSGVVDVLVQTQAGIGCPVWAPLKFVLQATESYMKVAEDILSTIGEIVDLLPRLNIYEQLVPEPELQVALLNLFAAIVNYCAVVFKYTQSRLPARLARVISSSMTKSSSAARHQLLNHAATVDKTAVAIELTRARSFREQQKAVLVHDKRRSVKQRLKPSDQCSYFRHVNTFRVPETTKWIWTQPELVRWRQSVGAAPPQRLLWVVGGAGVGKTFIAATLSEAFSVVPALSTMAFSFRGGDFNLQTTEDLVRSLLWQLLCTLDEAHRSSISDLYMNDESDAEETLWNLLEQAASLLSKPLICIIDGVDESRDSVAQLVGRIQHLQECSQNVSTVLLSRPHMLELAKGAERVITITPELLEPDIQAFVQTKMNEYSHTMEESTRQLIYETVTKNADGMFLWAKLMLDDLKRSNSKHELKQRLQLLPRGLEATYVSLLTRMSDELDEFELGLACTVLRLLTVAGRRMTLWEVSMVHALSQVSVEASASSHALDDFLLSNPTQSIAKSCRGFVTLEAHHTSLAHFSMREFLSRPMSRWPANADSRPLRFHFDLSASHHWLGSLCMDYLENTSADIDMQDADWQSKTVELHPFLDYAVSHVMHHALQSGNASSQLRERISYFLNSKSGWGWFEAIACSMLSSSSSDTKVLESLGFWGTTAGDVPSFMGLPDLAKVLESELQRRHEVLGPDHRRTQQCSEVSRLISVVTSMFKNEHVESKPPSGDDSGSIPCKELSDDGSPLYAKVPSRGMTPISHIDPAQLVESLKHDMRLSPQWNVRCLTFFTTSHLSRFKEADPTALLFRMILQYASKISGWVLYAAGTFYYKLDKYAEAKEIFQAGVQKLRSHDLWLRYVMTDSLALCHGILGDIPQAMLLLREVETGTRKFGGPLNRRLRLYVMSNLGWCLYAAEEHEEALTWTLRAVEDAERTCGAHDVWLQSRRLDLARVYTALDRKEAALKIIHIVVQSLENLRDHYDSRAINVMKRLVRILFDLEELQKARKWAIKQVEASVVLRGKDHEETLRAKYNLGDACYLLHDHEASESWLKQVVEIDKFESMPLEFRIDVTAVLVDVLSELHREHERLPWDIKCHQWTSELHGPRANKTRHARLRLGETYLMLANYPTALVTILDSLDSNFELANPEDTCAALQDIAGIYYDHLKDYVLARVWYERLEHKGVHLHEHRSEWATYAGERIASCLRKAKDDKQALDEALKWYRELPPGAVLPYSSRWQVSKLIGQLWIRLDEPRLAVPWLNKAFKVQKSADGWESAANRDDAIELVEALLASGCGLQAATLAQRVYEAEAEAYGPENEEVQQSKDWIADIGEELSESLIESLAAPSEARCRRKHQGFEATWDDLALDRVEGCLLWSWDSGGWRDEMLRQIDLDNETDTCVMDCPCHWLNYGKRQAVRYQWFDDTILWKFDGRWEVM